jgi:hypothetical protein
MNANVCAGVHGVSMRLSPSASELTDGFVHRALTQLAGITEGSAQVAKEAQKSRVAL